MKTAIKQLRITNVFLNKKGFLTFLFIFNR